MEAESFVPHPLLRGSFLQTLAPSLFPPGPEKAHSRRGSAPSPRPGARAAETVSFRCELPDGDALVLLEDLPLAAPPFSGAASYPPGTGTGVLLVGGLGSHARVPNLERLARKLRARGHRVWRMNHRGTGEGAGLSRGIYHAARTGDLHAAVSAVLSRPAAPKALVLVGYSLSGNMALRYVGAECARVPDALVGVVAASPVLDLAANAPLIPRAAAGFYDWNFLRELRHTVDSRHGAFPDLGPALLPRRLTLPEFDSLYTAPQAGFPSREAYYAEATSIPHLPSIRVRAHVVASLDDPFSSRDPRDFPTTVSCTLTRFGGHHGFFASQPGRLGDRFWLDGEIVRMVEAWSGTPG